MQKYLDNNVNLAKKVAMYEQKPKHAKKKKKNTYIEMQHLHMIHNNMKLLDDMKCVGVELRPRMHLILVAIHTPLRIKTRY